jgi:hypothetical protein
MTTRTALTATEKETCHRYGLSEEVALRALNARLARRETPDDDDAGAALVKARIEPRATMLDLTESERAAVSRYGLNPDTAARAATMLRGAKGQRAGDEELAFARITLPLPTTPTQ